MDVEIVDDQGNDIVAATSPPATDQPAWPGLPPAHARPGETRKQTWERLRVEARAAGMAKQEAYIYATREVDRVWVPPEPVVEPESPAPEPVVEVAPDPPAVVEPPQPLEAAPASSGGGVEGLGVLPEAWPTLPANATLATEVAWVQANRLRVVHGGGVDLSRSLSPAPSYAALAWLETSILFPAKWADVTLRATQDAHDDQADVRRERLALVEVQGLLSEAMGAAS